jgi:hypothetical protein
MYALHMRGTLSPFDSISENSTLSFPCRICIYIYMR